MPVMNTTSLVYELPFGRGRHFMDSGGILNQVLGQWQVSAVNQAHSGFPYQINYNPPTANRCQGFRRRIAARMSTVLIAWLACL